MDLTPTEKRFMDTLDRFGKLLPDNVHINPEGREARIRRELAWMTYPEVGAVLVKLTDVLVGISEVVDGVTQGGMRDMWVRDVGVVIKELTVVADILHTIAEEKLH